MTEQISNSRNETVAMEEATRFIEENIIPSEDGRACVDGRYLPNGESAGYLSRAGGDFGYVMGLLALGVNPIQSVDAVYAFVTKEGSTFYAHTDSHAEQSKALTGCGHIARAHNDEFSKMYEVDSDSVKEALDYLRNEELHPNVNEVMLEGDHAEKGVLIVKGKDKTLRHQDGNNQYFVYDKDRDDEFIERLVKDIDWEDITAEKLKGALETQTNATVQLLAGGKPVFEVDLSSEKPNVNFLFNVPTSA